MALCSIILCNYLSVVQKNNSKYGHVGFHGCFSFILLKLFSFFKLNKSLSTQLKHRICGSRYYLSQFCINSNHMYFTSGNNFIILLKIDQSATSLLSFSPVPVPVLGFAVLIGDKAVTVCSQFPIHKVRLMPNCSACVMSHQFMLRKLHRDSWIWIGFFGFMSDLYFLSK